MNASRCINITVGVCRVDTPHAFRVHWIERKSLPLKWHIRCDNTFTISHRCRNRVERTKTHRQHKFQWILVILKDPQLMNTCPFFLINLLSPFICCDKCQRFPKCISDLTLIRMPKIFVLITCDCAQCALQHGAILFILFD